MSVVDAFEESVDAASWIGGEHSALVETGKLLAAGLDAVDAGGYAELARLSLEFRNVCRQLGLVVEKVEVEVAEVVEFSPLDTIRGVAT